MERKGAGEHRQLGDVVALGLGALGAAGRQERGAFRAARRAEGGHLARHLQDVLLGAYIGGIHAVDRRVAGELLERAAAETGGVRVKGAIFHLDFRLDVGLGVERPEEPIKAGARGDEQLREDCDRQAVVVRADLLLAREHPVHGGVDFLRDRSHCLENRLLRREGVERLLERGEVDLLRLFGEERHVDVLHLLGGEQLDFDVVLDRLGQVEGVDIGEALDALVHEGVRELVELLLELLARRERRLAVGDARLEFGCLVHEAFQLDSGGVDSRERHAEPVGEAFPDAAFKACVHFIEVAVDAHRFGHVGADVGDDVLHFRGRLRRREPFHGLRVACDERLDDCQRESGVAAELGKTCDDEALDNPLRAAAERGGEELLAEVFGRDATAGGERGGIDCRADKAGIHDVVQSFAVGQPPGAQASADDIRRLRRENAIAREELVVEERLLDASVEVFVGEGRHIGLVRLFDGLGRFLGKGLEERVVRERPGGGVLWQRGEMPRQGDRVIVGEAVREIERRVVRDAALVENRDGGDAGLLAAPGVVRERIQERLPGLLRGEAPELGVDFQVDGHGSGLCTAQAQDLLFEPAREGGLAQPGRYRKRLAGGQAQRRRRGDVLAGRAVTGDEKLVEQVHRDLLHLNARAVVRELAAVRDDALEVRDVLVDVEGAAGRRERRVHRVSPPGPVGAHPVRAVELLRRADARFSPVLLGEGVEGRRVAVEDLADLLACEGPDAAALEGAVHGAVRREPQILADAGDLVRPDAAIGERRDERLLDRKHFLVGDRDDVPARHVDVVVDLGEFGLARELHFARVVVALREALELVQ